MSQPSAIDRIARFLCGDTVIHKACPYHTERAAKIYNIALAAQAKDRLREAGEALDRIAALREIQIEVVL